MGSATGLHHDRAGRLLLKKRDQLAPAQLPLDLRLSSLVHAMDLEDGLRGIQANHGNAHRGRFPSLQVLTNPHDGTSMPPGPSTPSVGFSNFAEEFVAHGHLRILMLRQTAGPRNKHPICS